LRSSIALPTRTICPYSHVSETLNRGGGRVTVSRVSIVAARPYCTVCTRRRARHRNRSAAQHAQLAITSEQRRRVCARDGWRCRHCGRGDDLTLDHVEPLARSRPRPWVRDDELQTLCRSCNSREGVLGRGRTG